MEVRAGSRSSLAGKRGQVRAPLMAASSPWLAAACLPAPHLSPFFLDLVSEAQPLAVEFRPQWSRRLPFSSLLVPRESENPRDGTQLPVPDASPHRGHVFTFPSGEWCLDADK